jgi:hypothetical protein
MVLIGFDVEPVVDAVHAPDPAGQFLDARLLLRAADRTAQD